MFYNAQNRKQKATRNRMWPSAKKNSLLFYKNIVFYWGFTTIFTNTSKISLLSQVIYDTIVKSE